MKTTLAMILTSGLLLLCTRTYSQIYYPLVQTNKVWSMSYYYVNPPSQIKYMKVGSDTMIASKFYSHILETDDSVASGWTQAGFMRETTDHMVYFSMNPVINEFLAYDFNLALNDNIFLHGIATPFIVDTIDSVQIASGEYRKRIILTNTSCPGSDTWIEGIGSLFGLIYSSQNCLVGESDKLVCLLQAGNLVYHDPLYTRCDLPMASNEIVHQAVCSIFPNPVSENIIITTVPQIREKFLLRDASDRILMTGLLNPGQNILNLSRLSPGIYFLQILNDQTTNGIHKIVKQ